MLTFSVDGRIVSECPFNNGGVKKDSIESS